MRLLIMALGLMLSLTGAVRAQTPVEPKATAASRTPETGNWMLLGTFEVDLNGPFTQYRFDSRTSYNPVRAIRLSVISGDIELSNIQVRYYDGTAHNERRDIALTRTEQTRPIDQRSEGHYVQGITLCHVARGGEARVWVYGLRDARDRIGPRPKLTSAITWPSACPDAPPVAEAMDGAAADGATTSGRKQSKGSGQGSSVLSDRTENDSSKAQKAPPFKPRGVTQSDDGSGKQSPGGGGAATADPCKDICTPVQIFFGTDRKRDTTAQTVKFGPQRAGQLQLGSAVVSVPRIAERRRGELRLPSWFERNILRIPAGGDPAKHFVIMTTGFKLYTSDQDFLAAVKAHMADAGEYKDHAFIFVHGYNVTFDAALYRTAQIAYDLGYDDPVRGHIPFGTAFLYSWPSGGRTQDYLYDGDSARLAAAQVKRFVELVTAQSGAKQVHLIAHSMGNLALLNALKDVKSLPGGARVNQVVLAAPDIDVGEFEELAQAIVPLARNVTLYASSKDVAMIAARQARRNAPRAGDVASGGAPIVVPKVFSIDISALSTDWLSWRHAEYADKKELLDDINRMLIKAEQPPDKRNTNFQHRVKGKDEYWQYAN